MSDILIWQQNSTDSSNLDHLQVIAKWWSSLAGKEIAWQQRILPPDNDLGKVDWQSQQFDERFIPYHSELRGITLFWRNQADGEERNITPRKMQLNSTLQQLLIFPLSQSQIVIKINLPGVVYQKLDFVDPQIAATVKNDHGIILLRDEAKRLEVKVTLSRTKLNQLLNSFKTMDNEPNNNQQ